MHDQSRRRFLSLAVAGAMALPARAAARQHADLLVVGGGAAGLAAAAEAAASGARVTLIEARDRVGGRVWTDRSLGPPLELGAAWIHGSRGNPLVDLARKAGVTPVPEPWEPMEVFRPGGRAMSGKALRRGEARLERALRVAERSASRAESLADALDRVDPGLGADAAATWHLAAFVEFSGGAAAGALSARLWDAGPDFGEDDLQLPDGMNRLLPPLPAGARLVQGSAAVALRHDADGVEVVTADGGRHRAGAAILAVPAPVLAGAGLRIEPALPPAMRSALAAQGRGAVAKIVLGFPRRPWPAGLRGFGLTGGAGARWPLWLAQGRGADGSHLVMGVATGPHALVADGMEDAVLQADALEALREGLGVAPPAPIALRRSRWGADPFSGLAYSFPRPGGRREDFDALSGAAGPRLRLAGEHTAFAHRATLHGAVLSGQRAARALVG